MIHCYRFSIVTKSKAGFSRSNNTNKDEEKTSHYLKVSLIKNTEDMVPISIYWPPFCSKTAD